MLKASPLLSLTLFAACSGSNNAPPPSEVRARLSEDLGHVLENGSAAARGGQDALHFDTAFSMLGHFTSAGNNLTTFKTSLGTISALAARSRIGLTAAADPADRSDIDQLIAELDNKIFTDANYQGDGIYKVPAELMCSDTLDGATTVDPDCVTAFDKLQLRLRVGQDADALTIALQVDADHDEPLRFALTHDSLAATIDLDETDHAIGALAPLFGETAPNAKLAGQLTGKVEILGPQHAELSLAIDRKLDIQFADTGISLASVDAFRFASAASQVASLAFDGIAGTGSLAVDLGATTAHVPGDVDSGEAATDLDLPGASITASLAAGQPAQLTHISLGDRTTTLSVGGQRAIAVDLNPDDGRALSATISEDTVTVSPKFDLRATVDHAVLGDIAPTYDITQVLVTGSLRGVGDQVEVVSGTFGITTNPAQFGFSASAGQCVTSTEVEDPNTFDLFQQFSVGACN